MSTVTLSLDEIQNLATRVFAGNGCDAANTTALARTVVTAERDGSHSHGLFRVPGYVASLRSGKVHGRANPRVTRKTPAIVAVDGDEGYVPLAIERGVPLLVEAARELGVACTCYMPIVAPAGGREPLFGTNPFSFAWPRPGRSPVVIDMATASMALGEVQIAARDAKSVPLGTGLDAAGAPTTDPHAILKGVLLPFGGYKGSAIALMVELLAAGAIGERFSFEAADADNKDGGPPRGGEFMMALSPELLAGPGWAEHCEGFFQRFDAIEGARLPGSRRHSNRTSLAPRAIDAALLERARALCP